MRVNIVMPGPLALHVHRELTVKQVDRQTTHHHLPGGSPKIGPLKGLIRNIGGRGVYSASGPSREIVSFRSCVRAGGRAARDHLRLPRAFCGTNVFVVVIVFCPGVAFSLFRPKNAQNVSRLMLFALLFTMFRIKTKAVFHAVCVCFQFRTRIIIKNATV